MESGRPVEQDHVFNIRLQPAKPLRLSVSYHYCRLAQVRAAWSWVNGKPERCDGTGQAAQELSHEADAVLRLLVNKGIELLAGYALSFTGEYVRNTPGN